MGMGRRTVPDGAVAGRTAVDRPAAGGTLPVTRALVLAAGLGSRLRHETPKPLFPVMGVPLLARTLFTLEQAGIADAYVVLGYEGERIRREIEKIDRFGIRIHWLLNDRWREPNGVSVLAAEGTLTEPFILTMSDHLFEVEAVERLRAASGRLSGILLVADPRIDAVNDPDDATKVRLEDGRIADIGKSLSDFDAIDTGVFLASPVLFAALRSVEGASGPSLSDGVRKLAHEGRAHVVDGSGIEWQDVDTQDDVRAAERMLLARWPKPSDGPVARRFNRRISTAITRRLAGTGITPNQVSVATMVVSLLSAACAAVGGYGFWLASGILFQLASILDGADGELAILTFQSSRRGEWIDTLCDNISYVAFLVGLTAGAHRAMLPPLYFWGGLAGITAAALSLMNINMYLVRERKSGSALSVRYAYRQGTGAVSRIMRAVHYLGRRDLFSFLVLLLAVVGRLPLALPLFGLGATLLLLPATTHANLSDFFRARRVARLKYG